MIQKFTFIITLAAFLTHLGAFSQRVEFENDIKYIGLTHEPVSAQQSNTYFLADGLDVDAHYRLPVVRHEIEIPFENAELMAEWAEASYQACTPAENHFIASTGYFESKPEIAGKSYTYRKKQIPYIEFIPVRLNKTSGNYEKLVHYKINVEVIPTTAKASNQSKTWAETSVLAQGLWYKFGVSNSGIYKITYNDLVNAGIDPAAINPLQLQLFGNAGYMLAEANDEPRMDDLYEVPIEVTGENDGSFDTDDYILFYGLSPHKVSEVLGFMLYDINLYDNRNYYFLTYGQNNGKRIQSIASSAQTPTHYINQFNDFRFYEEDNINLIESGKTWYAEEFGETLSRSYSFQFPDLVQQEDVVVKIGLANRTFVNDNVAIKINNQVTDTLVLTSVTTGSTKYAQVKKKTYTFNTDANTVQVDLTYNPADNSSRMWLNYIYVNAISELKLQNSPLSFRSLASVANNAVSKFTVNNTHDETRVWDVTDFLNPVQIETTFLNNATSFAVETSQLREFIAFGGVTYDTPEFIEKVNNQNLHGQGPADYVMVVYPDFMEQAQRLKAIHETHHGFQVLLTTPMQVYNEFSSGKQDPTAIRDLMKMLYDRYPENEPRFLLLFGDGSFDPKDRIPHNTNFIPTFQTEDSWITAQSYVIDDYFGLLDDDEGDDAIGYLDIGIGRLPVQTIEEAKIVVDKIEKYLMPGEQSFGDWRTRICIIADDEDGNLHLEQADSVASIYGDIPTTFNKNKIYLDAFPQQSTPSGDKYPEVVEMLNKQVNQGALIVNYIGHGGTGGWAHERILQQNDILGWKNSSHLPVFITATCEFSRFDEPDIVSGGEMVILNPNGGGIALFTTTRLAYSQSNFRLNLRLFGRAFTPVNGEMPYLGDLIRESKPPGQLTTRNFVLLGDPGIKMAYPVYNVNTLTINGVETASGANDTLNALQTVTITGEITDLTENPVSNFKGVIYPVLYDKTTVYKTIGNDNSSYPVEFKNQDKIVWKGKATVSGGKFSFTMVVPKDIALELGEAKISYYAHSDNADAFGAYKITLGGLNNDVVQDKTGPEIDLYINDLEFVSGDLTHENPLLLAFFKDENGINTSSNGIGHDITLIMNDNHADVMIVTDYFEPSLDDHQRGSLAFPFYNLPNGEYTLTLKAWDSFNNSSEKSIAFSINTNASLDMYNVMCHPNPFSEHTTFSFSHTKPGSELEVVLQVYNAFGKFVMSYETTVYANNTSVHLLDWDGRDPDGNKIARGMYLYTLLVTDNEGRTSRSQQKFIIR